MKHLRETFTDQEWEALKVAKDFSQRNWHDFIMCLTDPMTRVYPKPVLRDQFSSADGDFDEQLELWEQKYPKLAAQWHYQMERDAEAGLSSNQSSLRDEKWLKVFMKDGKRIRTPFIMEAKTE